MNVLFVGTQNVGRSQMAATLYNSLVSNGHADSAGTRVDEIGQTLGERSHRSAAALNVLTVMHELGFDLWHRKRKKLTETMLDEYDYIIVMADPDTMPGYLHRHPNALYWDIPDSYFTGIDATRETRDLIKLRVVDLIQNTRKES